MKKRTKPKTIRISRKQQKQCRFCGTSILKAFRADFGRVLGGQNPWFSHFFRYFFDAKFWLQVGRVKNRKKTNNTPASDFIKSQNDFLDFFNKWGDVKKCDVPKTHVSIKNNKQDRSDNFELININLEKFSIVVKSKNKIYEIKG